MSNTSNNTKTVLYYGKEIQVSNNAKYIHTDSNGQVYTTEHEYLLQPLSHRWMHLPTPFGTATLVHSFNHTQMSSTNWMLSQKRIQDLPSVCTGLEPTGHPHADLMLKYAQIAQYSAEPWEEFEFKRVGGVWGECSNLTRFDVNNQYRLKPQVQGIKEGQVWSSNSTDHKVTVSTFDFPKSAVLVKHEVDAGLYFWNELTSEELHKHFTLVK